MLFEPVSDSGSIEACPSPGLPTNFQYKIQSGWGGPGGWDQVGWTWSRNPKSGRRSFMEQDDLDANDSIPQQGPREYNASAGTYPACALLIHSAWLSGFSKAC